MRRLTSPSPPGHPGEYLARLVPPPDYLTPGQLDVFDHLGTPAAPSPPPRGQTPEQYRNWIALEFGWISQLEGVEVPDEADVLAEIDLRAPGWPGEWPDQLTLF